jgi:hypothetical protein
MTRFYLHKRVKGETKIDRDSEKSSEFSTSITYMPFSSRDQRHLHMIPPTTAIIKSHSVSRKSIKSTQGKEVNRFLLMEKSNQSITNYQSFEGRSIITAVQYLQ